jgi:hypothetical protein
MAETKPPAGRSRAGNRINIVNYLPVYRESTEIRENGGAASRGEYPAWGKVGAVSSLLRIQGSLPPLFFTDGAKRIITKKQSVMYYI